MTWNSEFGFLWETASSLLKRLRPLGHQGRPLIFFKKVLFLRYYHMSKNFDFHHFFCHIAAKSWLPSRKWWRKPDKEIKRHGDSLYRSISRSYVLLGKQVGRGTTQAHNLASSNALCAHKDIRNKHQMNICLIYSFQSIDRKSRWNIIIIGKKCLIPQRSPLQ